MRRVAQLNENSRIKPFSVFMVNSHILFEVAMTIQV